MAEKKTPNLDRLEADGFTRYCSQEGKYVYRNLKTREFATYDSFNDIVGPKVDFNYVSPGPTD
ncbi:MAG: hypothetical protein ABIH37_03185 [archaeon]